MQITQSQHVRPPAPGTSRIVHRPDGDFPKPKTFYSDAVQISLLYLFYGGKQNPMCLQAATETQNKTNHGHPSPRLSTPEARTPPSPPTPGTPLGGSSRRRSPTRTSRSSSGLPRDKTPRSPPTSPETSKRGSDLFLGLLHHAAQLQRAQGACRLPRRVVSPAAATAHTHQRSRSGEAARLVGAAIISRHPDCGAASRPRVQAAHHRA